MSQQPVRKRPSLREIWDKLWIAVGVAVIAWFVAPFLFGALGITYVIAGTFWGVMARH